MSDPGRPARPGTTLRDLLEPELILAPLEAESFHDAVARLFERIVASGAMRDPAGIRQLLADADRMDPVRIGQHVAFPHFRTDLVDRLVVALGVSHHGIATNQGRLRLIVLALAPTEAGTAYLQTVSAIARILRDRDVVQRLLEARSPDDVLAVPALHEARIRPGLAVRDLMAHGAPSVSPETPVREAVGLMVRNRARAMPVVGEKGEVLGIVSEWDIMRALLPQIPRAAEQSPARPEPTAPLRVRDIMTRSVLCISEDMELDEAANLMINKNVEQFPVVSEGKLTGFLTRGDIIRKLFAR